MRLDYNLELVQWCFDRWMSREERRLSRKFWPYTYRAVLGVDVSFSGRCTVVEKS